MPTAFIPSPPSNGFNVGPLFFHAYGIAYVFAVAAAILVSRRRWAKMGGNPDLVYEIALWAFPAGVVGGRIYFLITTPSQAPDAWWGAFAIWKGGLGIWGGVVFGAAVGLWRASRKLNRSDMRRLMDAVAPALLVAQAIGRLGNYFNQELYGKPSKLPWAREISRAHRVPGFLQFATFQPTFLYELLWNLLLAAFLIWLARSWKKLKAPGLFALYVAGYSGFRIYEEQLRIDFSEHFLGMRLNFFVSSVVCAAGLLWFYGIQRGWHPLERLVPRLRQARLRGEARQSSHGGRLTGGVAADGTLPATAVPAPDQAGR
ncbi:MAG: prolipoprotein diacylglyceryl transferase [Solirubrobacteraceae bacterium]